MTAAEQIKYNKALKEAEEIQKRIDDGVKIRLKTAERLGKKLEEISKFEEKTLKAKQAQYKAEADQLNLTEKIEKLSSSMLGNLSKKKKSRNWLTLWENHHACKIYLR